MVDIRVRVKKYTEDFIKIVQYNKTTKVDLVCIGNEYDKYTINVRPMINHKYLRHYMDGFYARFEDELTILNKQNFYGDSDYMLIGFKMKHKVELRKAKIKEFLED